MKKLNNAEVCKMALSLGVTEIQAKQIADVFYNETLKGNYRLQNSTLETVDSYILEYENCWFRYSTLEKLYESEVEQGAYAAFASMDEMRAAIGKSVFELECGLVIQCTY